MTDDDRMRRLLSDAVSDIEPRDRLAEIRASVHPDPQVVPMSRPRPWLYALSGAVASAAVIGVIAYTTHVLSGPDDDSSGLVAGQGRTTDPASAVTSATATDSDATPSSSVTSSPPVTSGEQAYAVYYVGANAAGRPVLFREWHRGPALPVTDAGGTGNDLLTEALHDAVASVPLDPDYRTPWHDLATLEHASYEGTGAEAALHIALRDTRIADRPTGMGAAEARAAVQQLVYTAQAAVGKRVPVVFTIGHQGGPTTLLGVDISQPIRNSALLRTLSLVTISSPNEGDEASGKLTVTGANNSFEGTSVIYLERHGKKYATTPTIGGWGGQRLYPWTVTLDLTTVPPGQYTLVAENDDPSGRGHPDTDTRTIEVR